MITKENLKDVLLSIGFADEKNEGYYYIRA